MHDIAYNNITEKILHLYMKNSVEKRYRSINALFPKKEIIQKYNIKYLSGRSSYESSAFLYNDLLRCLQSTDFYVRT